MNEENISRLDTFAADIKLFFESNKSLSLFKKLPVRYEPEITRQRLSEGRYLFSPCGVELNKSESNKIALDLFELLKKHLPEREVEVTAIADAMINEKINISDLLLQVIKNDGNGIMKVIRSNKFSEDLFTFFVIYLARPFRENAAEYFKEGIEKLNWYKGYCPVCGHWPALAHLNSESGHRTLWCLCCNTKWNFKRTQCAYCLNEDHGHLKILNPENEDSYRVQVCKKCKRYLKEVRSNTSVDDFPFDKFYPGTMALDIIAEREGYIQESILTIRYDNPDGNELLMYRQKERECWNG